MWPSSTPMAGSRTTPSRWRRFRDPKTGAVQVGVQMRNAETNLLARLQDFEFVVFAEIFQRARERLGRGARGNGQFVRRSALRSLGPALGQDV